MNDEQSKRLAEAADAIVQAGEALDEARELLSNRRFDSEAERDRVAAGQNLGSKADNAGKKIEDAIRKAVIAAAAAGRAGSYTPYRDATAAARDGRSLARTISDQDGSPGKRARAEEAMARLEAALDLAATLVFAA